MKKITPRPDHPYGGQPQPDLNTLHLSLLAPNFKLKRAAQVIISVAMNYRRVFIRALKVAVAGALLGSAFAQATDEVASNSQKSPRLLVLTDITSTESGVREPDDAQSMIRLLLYSNEFDIEGLIASSGLKHGHVARPQNIRRIVDAYAKVRPNLLLHDRDYPPAERLAKVIKSGQPSADEDMPVHDSIGPGKSTEASRWIIKTVDKPDPRPLWISIWGGPADLAQALWQVRHTRSPREVQKFIAKIRVLASGDQDSTGPWIKSNFPHMYYMTSHGGGRGMYRGGNEQLVSSAWVQKNIKGHGALGDLYPDYRGGDPWSYKLGPVEGIKSGDSSQFMGLIPNGLNVRNHLTWANWGGRNERDVDNPHHYHNAIDRLSSYQTDPLPYMASVYRWRPAFQAELAARFDWCVQPYAQANHAPSGNSDIVRIDEATSGQTVMLASGKWRDPDGDKLSFRWQVLKEESSYPDDVSIATPNRQPQWQWSLWFWSARQTDTGPDKTYSQTVRLLAPDVDYPQSIHVLMTVMDDGKPALSSYKRFNLIVYPQ